MTLMIEGGQPASKMSGPANRKSTPAAVQAVSRKPKYKEIRDELMRSILAGQYQPGDYLPSESELSKRFSVSRVTVRMALDLLRDAEQIGAHQGKGYFVRDLKAVQDLGRLQGFGEIMAPLGVVTRSEVLNAQKIAAPPEVAVALQLERGNTVIKIERLRIAANVTMSMDVSFFPPEIGEALLELDLAHFDVFKLIETKLGVEIGFADIVMDSVLPEESVRNHLKTADDERLIRIERLTYDTRGKPIDFEYLFGRPETHQFRLRVPRW